jgi:hypothetical protein
MPYIHRRYIPWFFHRLTKEYMLYSSVITEERVMVSCSDSAFPGKFNDVKE